MADLAPFQVLVEIPGREKPMVIHRSAFEAGTYPGAVLLEGEAVEPDVEDDEPEVDSDPLADDPAEEE